MAKKPKTQVNIPKFGVSLESHEGVAMINIKNIKTLDGQTTDLRLASSLDRTIEAKGNLLLLPGLIDSHISLGSPEAANWTFGVESAIRGGVTTILDVPSEDSPSETKVELKQKKSLVEKQLGDLKIPLRYFPYVKGNSNHIEELGVQKNLTLGSLLLFNPEESPLDDKIWDRIFQIAAWENLPVIINSRNENAWKQARFKERDETLLGKSIYYAERQNTRLYVLNVATREEIDLIQDARSRSLLIYAETTMQHLFPQDFSKADFLWEALNSGIIETIGSGYSVAEQAEDRILWQGANFNFLNPVFMLPLLLTAYHEGKITLEKIVRLTRINLYEIFNLERKDDNFVLVDLDKEQGIQRLNQNRTTEIKLRGWPEYVILKEHLFKSVSGGYHLTRVE